MGAGGSHPQATMMPDPWATYERPSANEGQATTGVPPETNKGTFALTKGFREARSRSATRNVETRNMVDEATPAFCKSPKCSRSALTRGRRSSTAMLEPRSGYRAGRAWGRKVETRKGQGEGEPSGAESMASSGALMAELAAQSEKKVSAACEKPPDLWEEPAKSDNANLLAASSRSTLGGA